MGDMPRWEQLINDVLSGIYDNPDMALDENNQNRLRQEEGDANECKYDKR